MRSRHKSIFLALFFLSGACGLTYEIVWSRLLVFVFGGATFAITTVLTCFMGGLALGSWLAGRLAARRPPRRPERLYGVLEILIGVSALAVPALLELGTGLYRALLAHGGDSFLVLTAARVLVAALVLLVPTTAMGATLPLLTSAFTRHDAKVGGHVAALYGANTFGAFVGCAGAGFFLLPRLGLSGSTLTVAILNLGAGTVALLMSRAPLGGDRAGAQGSVEDVPEPPAEPGEPRAQAKKAKKKRKKKAKKNDADALPSVRRKLLLLLYGLSGFAAMAYQIAWTRALILSMGSSTYSFSTIVSCYIFGLAAGSLLMARWADRLRRPLLVAGFLQSGIALSALFVVPLFGRLPDVVARATTAHGASFGGTLLLEAAWVFGLLIVPTLCMGALLPLVCRIYDPSPERAGKSVGDVYATNTAGTILGSALAGFVLIPWLGMEQTIRVASHLNLVVATFFLLMLTPRKGSRLALAGGVWLVALMAGAATQPWSREAMTSGPYLGREKDDSGWDLVFYRDGIDATVSVERSERGELSLAVNGKADASTLEDDMQTQSLAGALPMLLRPEARDVCLIGLGSGVTAGAILTFDVERLDLAEISQAVVLGSRLFDETSRAPLEDPRVALHRADGRNFLLLTDHHYDVVVSEPSNPWISGIANLFTREFFELSRSRLVPGGIHAQWLHGYSMDPDNFAAVLHTLEDVFGYVQVWEMALNDYLMLASTEPLKIDVEDLYFSFSRPELQEVLERIHVTNPLQLADYYVGESADMSSWLGSARLLTDDLPYLEFSAPRFLLATTRGEVAERLFAFPGSPRLRGEPVVGPLEEHFLAGAAATKTRARRFHDAQEAEARGNTAAQVEAWIDVVEAAPGDLRTLQVVMAETARLARSGAPVAELVERLNEVKLDSWPFTRRSPWPMMEVLSYAGHQLIDEGGDLREATAHLLRAWLRAPSDPGVLYDLARAYAGRGDREKALRFLQAAVDDGYSDAESLAKEPLFDRYRDEAGFPAL